MRNVPGWFTRRSPNVVVGFGIVVFLLSVARGTAAAQVRSTVHGDTAGGDSAFKAMQARGKMAMGVDQKISAHHFTPSADGGRIQLETDVRDSAGVARIRRHMREIARAFSTGDFSTPMFVHMREVPGTRDMARLRHVIKYTPIDLQGGGALQISTNDADAIRAIHEFIAFQQRDHRAGP